MSSAAASSSLAPRRAMVLGLVFGVFAAISLWQRLHLAFNGPYLDESDYLYVGRVLRSNTAWNTYTYVFSSHLPLRILGFGEEAGGLLGARALAALLGLCSLGFFFGATRRLFDSTPVAAWAVLLLALLASHVFISKFATYDIVCFFFFTASMWMLVEGLRHRTFGWLRCLLASVLFGVAVLSKYVVIIHAPVLALIVAVRRPRLLAAALLPCAALLTLYTYRHWPDLQVLYQGQILHAHARNSSRLHILYTAALYTGPLLVLALAGLAMQAARTGVVWRAIRTHCFLLLLAMPLIAMHVRSADIVSMFKHMVYPAAMLTPLAAWFLHRLSRRRMALACAITGALAGIGLYQTRQMERSFPDLRPMVSYLQDRLSPNTTILTEEGYVFRYAFPDLPARNLYEFTWFDNDKDGKRTPKDVTDAVWDGKPDYVMTFGQITPHLTEKLRSAILRHQYHKVYEQPYELSSVMTSATRGVVELWRRNGTYKGKYPL